MQQQYTLLVNFYQFMAALTVETINGDIKIRGIVPVSKANWKCHPEIA